MGRVTTQFTQTRGKEKDTAGDTEVRVKQGRGTNTGKAWRTEERRGCNRRPQSENSRDTAAPKPSPDRLEVCSETIWSRKCESQSSQRPADSSRQPREGHGSMDARGASLQALTWSTGRCGAPREGRGTSSYLPTEGEQRIRGANEGKPHAARPMRNRHTFSMKRRRPARGPCK